MTAPAAPAESSSPVPDSAQQGIMVALMLPVEQAKVLAVDGGLPPEDLHVTLAYLGKTSDLDNEAAALATLLDVVQTVAAQHAPVDGELSGVGRFAAGPNGDAFYLSYDSPGLEWLRAHLVAELLEADLPVAMDHGYTPHVTLIYLQPSDPSPIARLDKQDLTVDALTISWGDTRVEVPFGSDGEDQQGPEPEEIADSRSWAELRAARTAAGGRIDGSKSFFEESAHPRGPGGKFAAKDKPAGAGGELPPDWLDRLLAGDASFVKPKKGGKGKGKGRAKKPRKKRQPRPGRTRAVSAERRQARAERSRRARERRDRESLAELSRRDQFDEAMDREKTAEEGRRDGADKRIDTEPDPKRKAALREQEADRRKEWTKKQAQTRREETTRRRRWELDRRRRQAEEAAAEARVRAKEEQERLAAEAADEKQRLQQQAAADAEAAAAAAGKPAAPAAQGKG